MAVLMAVGGAAGALAAVMLAALAVFCAIGLLWLLGEQGVQGLSGLVADPLEFVPHNWVTALALGAGIPMAISWARSSQKAWRLADSRMAAERELGERLYHLRGEYPSQYDMDRYLVEHPDALPHGPSQDRSWLQWLAQRARVAIVCATGLVMIWELGRAFDQGTANAPAAAFVLLVVIAGVGWLIYRSVAGRVELGRRAPYIAPIAVLFAGAAFGAYGGILDRSNGLLRDYCEYGAVSRAQLQGCLDHVTDAMIYRLHTDAAQFAEGELTECLSDSGPFCARRLEQMQQADAESGQ